MTIGELIDRIYREYLTPPSSTPAATTLTSDINNSTPTIPLDSFLAPEEEARLGTGAIMEIGRELLRVLSVDTVTPLSVTVARAVLGTTATSHSDGDVVFIAPRWTRQSVFDAVGDAIEQLSDELPGLTHSSPTAVSDWAELTPYDSTLEIGDAVEVVGANLFPEGDNLPAWTKNAPRIGIQPAFQSSDVGKVVTVRYRHRYTRPTDETTTLATLNLTGRDQLIMIGAVVSLVGSSDLELAEQEFIAESLAAQGYPVGSGIRVQRALIQWRELLLSRAQTTFHQSNRPTIRQLEPW